MNKFPQKSVVGRVYKTILDRNLIEKGDSVVVALSGGPDSVCLLSVLGELKDTIGFSLSAAHFNHRLRGAESDLDSDFSQKICQNIGIDCHSERAPKKNLYKNEESAREARYRFFASILEEGRGGKIALAHHQDDMAETMLLRLIRGSGLKGLGAIPFHRTNFIRPLLSISRDEIIQYLKDHSLAYRTDASNFDQLVPRNFLRHKAIPELEKLNPNLKETLANTSLLLQDDNDFVEGEAKKALANIRLESIGKVEIDLKKWLKLHPSIQRSVLRLAVEEADSLKDISFKHIIEVTQMLKKGSKKKFKLLPHSLRIELRDAKIVILKIK